MTVKDQVIEAQAAIINNLAKCEEAIAELYSIYSRTIPSLTTFWKDLSDKEKVHAKLLTAMHKQLANGNIFYNLGRFDAAQIEAFLKRMTSEIKSAAAGKTTPRQAVETALSIEASVLDAHFYDIVKSDAAEFRFIAERLSADTHDHVKTVKEKLNELLTAL